MKTSINNQGLHAASLTLARAVVLGVLCISFLQYAIPSIQAQPPKSGPTTKPTAQTQRSLELNERGVLSIQARNFSEAEALFTKALEADSHNVTAVFNLAGMYITNKKEPQAVALLNRYIKNFPKDAGLYARLGDAYFGSQDLRNAISQYETTLKLNPQYPGVPARLATLYVMTQKLDKAALMYQQAIRLNPKDLQSLKNLSNVYLGLNKPRQAITTAKKALQISASSDLYVTLGNAYQETQDIKNALNAFKRARDMGHSDPNLTKVIEELSEKSTKGLS